MRTRSGAALLGLTLTFLIVGVAALRWELISLAIPMAVFMFLGFFLNRPPLMDLRVERILESDKVQKDEQVWVELTIENRGERLDFVEVAEGVPPGAALTEGRTVFPLRLDRGEKVSLRYRVSMGAVGNYEFTGIRVRWWDPALLYSRQREFACVTRVQVIPRVYDLRKCALRPSSVRTQAGNVPSRALGPGMEFFCLREYVEGDELRRINWKATSRTDRLTVNDFQMERSGDVVVVVDARTALFEERHRRELVDRELEVASSLSSYFLKERNRVGLLLLGESLEIAKPAYGKRQFYRIVDKLLLARPGILKSTVGMTKAIDRYFPHGSMLVIVSPLEDKIILETIEELVRRRHEVLVVSLDGYLIRTGGERRTPGIELAERVHRLEREDLLSELGRSCRVRDWDMSAPLSKCLMEGRHWRGG